MAIVKYNIINLQSKIKYILIFLFVTDRTRDKSDRTRRNALDLNKDEER